MTHQSMLTRWRKSTRSEPYESCVEVAFTDDHSIVGVRDSKHPAGPVLAVTAHDWETFIRSIRHVSP